MRQVSILSSLILLLVVNPLILIQSQSCKTNVKENQEGISIINDNKLNTAIKSFEPTLLAFDSQWNLYFVDSGHQCIFMYPTNKTTNQNPTQIVSNVSPTNRNAGRLLRFSPENPNNVTVIAGQNNELQVPRCIYVDENDRNTIYICDSTNRILKYSNDGLNMSVVMDGRSAYNSTVWNSLFLSRSIKINSDNQQMYVSAIVYDRLIRLNFNNNTNQGEIVSKFRKLSGVQDFIFDSNKNLYVTDDLFGTGEILKYLNCCENKTFCQYVYSNANRIRKLATSLQILQCWIQMQIAVAVPIERDYND
ncbi:hypothetical protein I4U23_005379 [Adineta vaga]|nr:hypothetical protein I4U23_005379 [Adineta vaga]